MRAHDLSETLSVELPSIQGTEPDPSCWITCASSPLSETVGYTCCAPPHSSCLNTGGAKRLMLIQQKVPAFFFWVGVGLGTLPCHLVLTLFVLRLSVQWHLMF